MKMKQNSDKILRHCLPIFIGLSLRSIITLQPHGGQNKPPMYGDYEAQRHWMEITTNLPLSDWYVNTTDNDLNYWGLDYPPITAYHSWLLGKLAGRINTNWTEIHRSRGLETKEHKLFMRYTVLLSDLLIFMPAVLYFFYRAISNQITSTSKILSLFYSVCLMLCYPGLILIDHGHFQYNCISLGLFVCAICCFFRDSDLLGSFFYCFALNYKQMELYHALPLFFYLIGKCARADKLLQGIKLFVKLSLTVLITFFIIYLPFMNSVSTLMHVFRRLFPIDRGLYEDKVSNFWCATSPFIKWPLIFDKSQLFIICSMSVFSLSFPICIHLLFKPSKLGLLLSLTTISMIFYLFSFQVHEKSILLVAIPALLLYPFYPLSTFLFSFCSTLSMWPLLKKDGLSSATLSISIFYLVFGYFVILKIQKIKPSVFKFLFPMSLLTYTVLIFCDLFIKPPDIYPDLFALLNSFVSFLHFTGFLLFWQWNIWFGDKL